MLPSPVREGQLNDLLTDVMWEDNDAAALRRAGDILAPRVKEVLDVWYEFIGSTSHLVSVFRGADGEPDVDYLERVRRRFEQWVIDLCTREFDGQWLAYQEEIGLRHHTSKKNQTDDVDSPSGHVPMKDMMALVVPVTITLVLWSRPYAGDLW